MRPFHASYGQGLFPLSIGCFRVGADVLPHLLRLTIRAFSGVRRDAVELLPLVSLCHGHHLLSITESGQGAQKSPKRQLGVDEAPSLCYSKSTDA